MLRHFPIGSLCQSSSCGCVRLADLQKMLSLWSIYFLWDFVNYFLIVLY